MTFVPIEGRSAPCLPPSLVGRAASSLESVKIDNHDRVRYTSHIMKNKALLFVLMCAGIALGGLAQESPLKLKVVTDQANIRKEPDIGSPIIHMAPQGAVLEGESHEGEWYRVRFISDRGQAPIGFVHESLVIVTSRLPEVKQPAEPPPPLVKKLPPEQPATEVPPPALEQRTVTPEPPSGTAAQRPQLRLSLWGGFSYRSVGDLNTGAQGLADYYADVLASPGDTGINPLHLPYLFGGEFQGELLPRFFLGIGLDYLRGSRERGIFYAGSGDRATYTTRPEIRALPLRLTVSYFIHPRLYLKAGVEYYLAQARYSYRLEQDDSWEEWQGKASSQGFGLMGGIGLETDISPGIGFFAEVTGHLAKLSDFEGTDIHSRSGESTAEEDGMLYLYQGHVSPQISYPLVYIRERKPAEAGVSDAQLAGVDLSGVVLRVGFSFRF